MKIKVESRIDLPVLRISEKYDEELERTVRESARLGKEKAQSAFEKKYRALEPNKHSQHIRSSFKIMRGKKQYRGHRAVWLFGVFGSAAPEPNTKGGWENTLGGRAHFFEYGRSAPGGGRAALGSRLYRMAGGNTGAAEVGRGGQPPRPFMRSAKASVSRKYNGLTAKRLKALARKLNTRIR